MDAGLERGKKTCRFWADPHPRPSNHFRRMTRRPLPAELPDSAGFLLRPLLICTLIVIAPLARWSVADDVKPIEGSLLLQGKTLPLKFAVAYAVGGDAPHTTVIASDRRIAVAEIKKSLADNDGGDSSLS